MAQNSRGLEKFINDHRPKIFSLASDKDLLAKWAKDAGLRIWYPDEMPESFDDEAGQYHPKRFKPYPGFQFVITSPSAKWEPSEKTKLVGIWRKQPKVIARQYKLSEPLMGIPTYIPRLEIFWLPNVNYQEDTASSIVYTPKVSFERNEYGSFPSQLEAAIIAYCGFSPIQLSTPEPLMLVPQPVWEQGYRSDMNYSLAQDDILCFASEVGKTIIPGKDAMRMIKGQVGVS